MSNEHRHMKRWDKQYFMKFCIVVLFYGCTSFALADDYGLLPGSGSDIVRFIITGLFSIIAFFLIRTLNKFDKNQDALFDRMRTAEEKIAKIEGRCEERSH